MECVLAGNKLHRARQVHIEKIPMASRILMLGEGCGHLLTILKQRFPNARITVVDQSQRMLNEARKSVVKAQLPIAGIEFVCLDVMKEALPDSAFDLVTCPFFLDCFESDQLSGLIPSIARVSSRDSIWLVTDFQLPKESGWKHKRARCIHWLMYTFFRATTGIQASKWIDADPWIKASGYKLESRSVFDWELIRSDIWKRS